MFCDDGGAAAAAVTAAKAAAAETEGKCLDVDDDADGHTEDRRNHITPGLNGTQEGEIESIKTEINKSKMYKNSCYDN